MDIVKLLPEYLDTGLEDGELNEIAEFALAQHIKQLKVAIANSVINARSATLMDNMEGSSKALGEARKFKKQYHHFQAELARLRGSGIEETNEDD